MKMKKKSINKAKVAILETRTNQIKKVRLNFEEVQSTNQYIETHYFKQTSLALQAYLVQPNAFWLDYATSMAQGSATGLVMSANFIWNASQSLSALMTFAVLDLPFEAKPHAYQNDEGRGMTVKAGS